MIGIVLIILSMILIIGIYVRNQRAVLKESFGDVPAATQSSYLPKDMPGATTADPTVAMPTDKEVIDARDLIEVFQIFYNRVPEKQSQFQKLQEGVPAFLKTLDTLQAAPESLLPEDTHAFYTTVNAYKAAVQTLKQAPTIEGFQTSTMQKKPVPVKSMPIMPTQAGTNPNVLSLQDMRNLIKKIEEEKIRLENLRSTSATTIARISQLEKLGADVRDIYEKVERKQMKLEDVPIKPADAAAFLQQLKMGGAVPALLKPKAANVTTPAMTGLQQLTQIATQGPMQASSGGSMQANQDMYDYLKRLQWSFEIKVKHDPGIAHREFMVKKLEELERRIAAYTYSETPIPQSMQNAFTKELLSLSNMLRTNYGSGEESTPWNSRLVPYNTRMEPDSRADFPTLQSIEKASGKEGTGYNPFADKGGKASSVNADAMRRPGFVMTDDTIQHRNSAASFNESNVGGLNYKERAKDLCRQIRSSQLGDPVNFGCIENPDAVSASYSWKGNFEMVCNRLGDTWGAWYPSMFGCKPYDPTAKYKGTML